MQILSNPIFSISKFCWNQCFLYKTGKKWKDEYSQLVDFRKCCLLFSIISLPYLVNLRHLFFFSNLTLSSMIINRIGLPRLLEIWHLLYQILKWKIFQSFLWLMKNSTPTKNLRVYKYYLYNLGERLDNQFYVIFHKRKFYAYFLQMIFYYTINYNRF